LHKAFQSWLDWTHGKPLQYLRVADLIFRDDLADGSIGGWRFDRSIVMGSIAFDAADPPFFSDFGMGRICAAPTESQEKNPAY